MSLRALIFGAICFMASAAGGQETDVRKTREYSAITGIPIFAMVGSES